MLADILFLKKGSIRQPILFTDTALHCALPGNIQMSTKSFVFMLCDHLLHCFVVQGLAQALHQRKIVQACLG
jgi:hypothetical protein